MKEVRIAAALLAIVSIVPATKSIQTQIWQRLIMNRPRTIYHASFLDNAGVIGSYWTSYYLASLNPEGIVGTPHDADFQRNPRLVPRVLEAEHIYVCSNFWLEAFPDTLEQFHHLLIRKDVPSDTIGVLFLQEYHLAGKPL